MRHGKQFRIDAFIPALFIYYVIACHVGKGKQKEKKGERERAREKKGKRRSIVQLEAANVGRKRGLGLGERGASFEPCSL